MYTIDYWKEKDKFIVFFNDIDFIDAVSELRYYNIYYDSNLRRSAIDPKKIIDIISILDYNEVEYNLTNIALDEFKRILASYIPEQKYFRRNEFDTSILNPEFILKNYQNKGLEFTLSRSRSLISDDPGLGKTAQAICTFADWYKKGSVDKIFIVVRSGLPYHWKEEILMVTNVFNENDIVIINNKNKKDVFGQHKDKKIIIAPNHLLKHIFLYYKKGQNLNKSAKKIRWKSYVNIPEKLGTDKLALIIDEAHELTNRDAISTKALLTHIDCFDYRLALSATPNGNRFEKYFNVLQLLDSKALPFTELAFKCFISKKMGDDYNKYAIIEYDEHKIEELKTKVFNKYFIKRIKSELPEMKFKKIMTPIYMEMNNKYKELYNAFMQHEIDKIEMDKEVITLKSILNKFPYLQLIIDNPLLLKDRVTSPEIDKLISKWKLEYDERFTLLKILLKSYIEEDGNKVVIFDNHPATINMLGEEFSKYKPLLMHGQLGYNEEDKKRVQDLFNDVNNDHRLLIANPSVAGIGVNFNKGSNRIIYYTLPNDGVLFQQSIDRCFRINNTQDAIVQMLLYNNSIDIIRYNRNINKMILNEKFLTKELTRSELKNLLQMSINSKNF